MNPKPRSAAVLLSRDLYVRIADRVIVEELPGITLKGIDEPRALTSSKDFLES